MTKSVFRLQQVYFTSIFVLALTACGGGGNPAGGGTGTGTGCSATSVPGAPTISSATSGNASATINFSAPASNGGSAISGYIVTSSPDNFTATGTGVTSITVNGLANGTPYTFTIQAVNCLGTGSVSVPSALVTPSTVPDAPTGVTATAGYTQASVSFTPPLNNGGALVTNYTVTSNPSAITATGTASPIVITGLAGGTSYTFTVAASNVSGTGPTSTPSVAVITTNVPGAPTGIIATAGNAQASVAFTPSANTGGLTVTGYTVTSSPGGITASGTASPISISGLTNNTAYTFIVTAVNADGSSVPSAASNSVIPISNPGPYFVDPVAGLNTNPGTSALPFKTITYSLAVAAGVGTANTINAAAGTYTAASGETFPLKMVNNVNLIGAGSATTTINGGGPYAYATPWLIPAITPLVIGSGVTSTVSGFTITGGYSMSTWYTIMVVIDNATNATLSNNVIYPGATLAGDGVWIAFAANASLTGNTITSSGYRKGYGALVVASVTTWCPTVSARSNSFSNANDVAMTIFGSGNSCSPTVDLGTAASPGNNVINGPTTTSVGLNILGVSKWVNASGNAWHANIQGASATGTYAVGTIGVNPTLTAPGNNYAIQLDNTGMPSAGLQF